MVQTDFPKDLGAATIRLSLDRPALLGQSVQWACFGILFGLCGIVNFPATAQERLKVERVWTCWGLGGLGVLLVLAAILKVLAWRRLRGQAWELVAEHGTLRLLRVAAWGPTTRTWRLDDITIQPMLITHWLRHKSGDKFPGGGLALPAGWNDWLPRAMARSSNVNLLVLDAFACFPPQSSQVHALVLIRNGEAHLAAVASEEQELEPYRVPADGVEIWSYDRKSAALAGKILGKPPREPTVPAAPSVGE